MVGDAPRRPSHRVTWRATARRADQLADGGLGVLGRHDRAAGQHRVHARPARAPRSARASRCPTRTPRSCPRARRPAARRCAAVSTEKSSRLRLLIPITSDVGLQRDLQLLGLGDLDDGVQVQRAGGGVQLGQLSGRGGRRPTTSSTASAPSALASNSMYSSTVKSLRRIGRSAGLARGAQVVQRAAEVALLGEHRQRGRAAALVGGHDLGAGAALADHAGRRRAALVLGYQRRARAAPAPRRTGGRPPRARRPAPRARRPGRLLRRCSRASCVASTRDSRRAFMRASCATYCSSTSRAAPESMASSAAAGPLFDRVGQTAHVYSGPGVQCGQIALRARPRRPAPRGRSRRCARGCRRPPRTGARRPGRPPRGSASSCSRCPSARSSTMWVGPEVLSSSRPSSEATSRACSQPSSPSAPAMMSRKRRSETPISWRRGPGRVGQRAQEVEDGAHGQALAHRHHVLHGRVVARART